VQKDGEIMLKQQMKKMPALQPYARKPCTTYIFTFLVATPFIIFTGPVLSLLGLLGKTRMYDNVSLPYMTAKLGIFIRVAGLLSHD